MLEKETANSAEAKPKRKAEAASRLKKETTPRTRSAAGRPAAPRGHDDVHERIQRRAYELWESEGCPDGREQANWLQAESEIARARSQRVGVSR